MVKGLEFLILQKIRSFGIVAYGRDHISDVSVSTIEFYY